MNESSATFFSLALEPIALASSGRDSEPWNRDVGSEATYLIMRIGGHITYSVESGGFRPDFLIYKLRPVFYSMLVKCSRALELRLAISVIVLFPMEILTPQRDYEYGDQGIE